MPRLVMRSLLVLAVLLVTALPATPDVPVAATQPAERPNVLVFITDDQRAGTTAGQRAVQTWSETSCGR